MPSGAPNCIVAEGPVHAIEVVHPAHVASGGPTSATGADVARSERIQPLTSWRHAGKSAHQPSAPTMRLARLRPLAGTTQRYPLPLSPAITRAGRSAGT